MRKRESLRAVLSFIPDKTEEKNMKNLYVKFRDEDGCLTFLKINAIGLDVENSIWFEDEFDRSVNSSVAVTEEVFNGLIDEAMQAEYIDLSDEDLYGRFF